MNKKMKLRILSGPPGSGKSHRMRAEAETLGGNYIFAYPSTALLKEQATAFRKAGKLHVFEAYHEPKKKQPSVKDQLTKCLSDISSNNLHNCVILITHASLQSEDLVQFSNWHFCIDEAPLAVQSGRINTSVSSGLFEEYFDLDCVSSGPWHEVSLKGGAVPWGHVKIDNLAKSVSDFFKLVSSNSLVFVTTASWKEKRFGWCAIWAPHLLKKIAQSVTIASASYQESLGGKIAKSGCDIENILIDNPRVAMPNIRINYFTEKHRGSSAFWSTSEGRLRIVKTCDYLSKYVPDLGYWSGNDSVKILMEHRIAGEMISSKSAGLNSYDDCEKCALIYSSKATPDDEPVKLAFNFTDEDILRSREQEDIFQFVLRGAIRRPDFGGTYDIYLYDMPQAEQLQLMLARNGFTKIELVPIEEAGLLDDEGMKRSKARPKTQTALQSPRTGKTIKSESEKRAERRRKQAAANPPAKRGRPRKS